MSLRDLVTFAQNEISHGRLGDTGDQGPYIPTGAEPALSQADDSDRVPAEDDLDLPTIGAERPAQPDWLDPENEIIEISGSDGSIFSEGDFEEPITTSRTPARAPDVLAWYRPFHFYPDGIWGWGIYLRATGILELAAHLKGAPITQGKGAAIEVARRVLLGHELFHCMAEAAATRAEVIVRSPVYRPYFRDRIAAAREEAMANAYAYSQIAKAYPSFITPLESWMGSQGPGYRDFHHFTRSRFRRGKLVCSQHIVRFVKKPADIPAKLPCEFLFGTAAKNVPTYLVIEAGIASQVLRPFPKYNGVLVKVHSREHPPPHIHIEIPPGNQLTKYVWGDPLRHVKGQPALSSKDEKRLMEYLHKFGNAIHHDVTRKYAEHTLRMPAFLAAEPTT